METRHVTIGSTRLAVHLTGRGPLAVLVHGYPLDHRMWLDTMHGPLAEQRTLAAVDLRGHGSSPWSGDQVHTMDQFADDTAAVVRTLSDHAVDVVGLSMGGYAVQALWAKHPTFVRSLALVSTRSIADDDAAKAGRDAAIRTVLEKGRSAIASGMLGKLLAERPANDEHAQLLQARVRTMITSLPVETFVADLRGLRDRPDRTSMLGTILVPTLVVTGSEDPIATPAESKRMADAIRGARCVVLPGCAHLTPMEDPAAFARELGGFWRGVG
jgi:pimeloyl-ACP methyl ester carboxylesterase